MTLEKFKRVWDPIDRVVFGLIKYICSSAACGVGRDCFLHIYWPVYHA